MQEEKEISIDDNDESVYDYELYLSNEQGWSDILVNKNCQQIQFLYLKNCGIDDNSLSALLNINWPQLIGLALNRNKITVRGVRKLGKAEMPKLSCIYFNHNKIEDEGLSILLQKIIVLKQLLIKNCSITVRGIEALVDYNPEYLQTLKLSHNNIGNAGVKLLVKANLPNLHILYICNCGIQSQGFKQLTKANWPNLFQFEYSSDFNNEDLNKIDLNGWQLFNTFEFQSLKNFTVKQVSSICWLNIVLNKGPELQFDTSIDNDYLDMSISDVLYSLETFNPSFEML